MATTIHTDIAKNIDIVSRKGDTFVLKLTIKDSANALIDLSSYTAKFFIKNSSGVLVAGATSGSSSNVLLQDDDTTIHGISSNATTGALDATGVLYITIQSDLMTINKGTYKYDLELTSNSIVTTWMFGKIKIVDDVS
jgi:hypothetical protein